LNAKYVRLRAGEGGRESLPSDRPSMAFPGSPSLSSHEDIPGHDPNRAGIRLCGRHQTARREARPGDQAKPAGQCAGEDFPREQEGASKKPFRARRRIGRPPSLAPQAHQEPRQDHGNCGEGPLPMPKRLKHEDRPGPAAEQDEKCDQGQDDRLGPGPNAAPDRCRSM